MAAPLGRRGFIAGGTAAAAATTLALATSTGASAATSKYNKFLPLTPLRLCDTRSGAGRNFGFSSPSNKVTRVQIAGREINGVTVPANATAAVFTLVGINRASQRNYLSAFPSGTSTPDTSSLNMASVNAVVPNLVTSKLGNGSVDIFSNRSSDIILDLAGVYVPSESTEKAGRFQDFTPRRVLDTRNSSSKPGADSTVRVDLTGLIGSGGLDADATAASINLTAAAVSARGYLTAYPFGEEIPETSSLNVVAGQNRAIGAMVKLGRDSSNRLGFNVFVKSGAHVIVDVSGFITGESATRSSGGLFVPLDPVRLLDTRSSTAALRGSFKESQFKKRLWPGWTRGFTLPSSVASEAGTAVLNLTAVRTMDRGFFSVNAAQTRVGTPTTSSLNAGSANDVLANHVVTRASNKGVEIYSSAGGDVIADMVGYFKSGPVSATTAEQVDPAPPPIAPPYTMVAPSISLMNSGRSVVTGANATATVDSGRLWHWTGTAFVGQGRNNVSTFGHRTDAGGPFRFIEQLGSGDQIFMTTSDNRTYVYRYLRRAITFKTDSQILAETQRGGSETLSLIACTVGNDRTKSAWPNSFAPTSLEWRLIVTFSFERWDDNIALQ
ncbi:MAG: sortase [Ilumatobacter sp.]